MRLTETQLDLIEGIAGIIGELYLDNYHIYSLDYLKSSEFKQHERKNLVLDLSSVAMDLNFDSCSPTNIIQCANYRSLVKMFSDKPWFHDQGFIVIFIDKVRKNNIGDLVEVLQGLTQDPLINDSMYEKILQEIIAKQYDQIISNFEIEFVNIIERLEYFEDYKTDSDYSELLDLLHADYESTHIKKIFQFFCKMTDTDFEENHSDCYPELQIDFDRMLKQFRQYVWKGTQCIISDKLISDFFKIDNVNNNSGYSLDQQFFMRLLFPEQFINQNQISLC